MNNIVFDEENPVTSDQLIWALFGKSTEDVARMFRNGDCNLTFVVPIHVVTCFLISLTLTQPFSSL